MRASNLHVAYLTTVALNTLPFSDHYYTGYDGLSETIRCTRCSTWQHLRCNTSADRGQFGFICRKCKKTPQDALHDTHDSHRDSDLDTEAHLADIPDGKDILCPVCKSTIYSERGGVVVEFGCVSTVYILHPTQLPWSIFASLSVAYIYGRHWCYFYILKLLILYSSQSFFHVDCFRCAKCGNKPNMDDTKHQHLLLSDGSPLCLNCSYSCKMCHTPILNEAIITGDDSYHAHCFICGMCKNRIDDLVFAKTSRFIYCMRCHSERLARSAKHKQKKAERKRGGGSTSSLGSSSRARLEITGYVALELRLTHVAYVALLTSHQEYLITLAPAGSELVTE